MDSAGELPNLSLQTFDENKVLELFLEADERDSVFRYIRFGVKTEGPRISASGSLMAADVHICEFAQEVEAGNRFVIYDIGGESSISMGPTDQRGHFEVSIWVGNIEADRAWISFETDQTAVMPFVKNLERIASAER